MAMLIMAMTMTLGFTACGDDDDDETGGGNGNGANASATYTVSADKLEIVYEMPSYVKSVETATFNGDECTSWKTVFTYASSSYADQAWSTIEKELGDMATDMYARNGKVITMDQGAIAGLSYCTYESVKQSFDVVVASYEKAGVKVTRK